MCTCLIFSENRVSDNFIVAMWRDRKPLRGIWRSVIIYTSCIALGCDIWGIEIHYNTSLLPSNQFIRQVLGLYTLALFLSIDFCYNTSFHLLIWIDCMGTGGYAINLNSYDIEILGPHWWPKFSFLKRTSKTSTSLPISLDQNSCNNVVTKLTFHSWNI